MNGNRGELQQALERALAAASRSQDEVGRALLGQDPEQLVRAAQAFQASVAELSERVQRLRALGPLSPSTEAALREIGQAIGRHREACLRRSAVVEQSVQSLLPGSADAPVYGDRGGPYGASQRRSGAFRLLSA